MKEAFHDLFRFIKFKVGELLVGDEKGINLDAVIFPVLSPRISLCYQGGSCKRFLNPSFTIQVKPLETSYHHLLEQ